MKKMGIKLRIRENEDKISRLNLWRFGWTWFLFVFISVCLLGLGIWGLIQQERYGDIVTGMRNPGMGGAAWGLYVVFIIYFIGVSFAGITISALVRIFGIDELKPLTRPAELLTIISLILGAMSVLADQGRILYALLNLPRYARVMSPMFGTFTMVVSGYLFASVVYFFLSGRQDAWIMSGRSKGIARIFYRIWTMGFRGREDDFLRHVRTSFWLAIFILPMLVVAHSTLGFIFGIQAGRPGWFSALQAPGFVVMAGISGIGMIIFIAALLRKIYKLENIITEKTFRTLGLMLFVLTITYIYFMIVEELTANYAAPQQDRRVAHAISFGPYAPYFWLTVAGLIFPTLFLFYQFISQKTYILPTVVSGLLVNVAAIAKRFIIVVPSQTHGLYLTYPEGKYDVTDVEIAIVLGLFGFGTLLYLIFSKIFPIIPLESLRVIEVYEKLQSREKKLTSVARVFAAFITLFLGLSLMVVGFLSSARFWTEYYLDPTIPFAPVIFILGVMLSFISAIVYEVFPGKYEDTKSS